jgi:hypothetical protein
MKVGRALLPTTKSGQRKTSTSLYCCAPVHRRMPVVLSSSRSAIGGTANCPALRRPGQPDEVFSRDSPYSSRWYLRSRSRPGTRRPDAAWTMRTSNPYLSRPKCSSMLRTNLSTVASPRIVRPRRPCPCARASPACRPSWYACFSSCLTADQWAHCSFFIAALWVIAVPPSPRASRHRWGAEPTKAPSQTALRVP